MRKGLILLVIILALAACGGGDDNGGSDEGGSEPTDNGTTEETTDSGGEDTTDFVVAQVINIVDGDTIDVEIDGEEFRVRYIGINTPEIAHGDEPGERCGSNATTANARLVEDQEVRLERDVSDTDQYGRLLRYVYVGDIFVNEELVRLGFAEVVKYEPDIREYENFLALEQEAAAAPLGCHYTGIFDDDSYER